MQKNKSRLWEMYMEQFSLTKEILSTVIKWFLCFVIINNLIWVSVFAFHIKKTYDLEPTSIVQRQDGHDNTQRMAK